MRNSFYKKSDLPEMNRSVVIKILQQQEICSRADIARQTGLTQAAISKIIATLMDRGIVVEKGSMKGNANRRSIGLMLNSGSHQVIGVKFAREMFEVGVFDISGKIYTQKKTRYSLNDDPNAVLSDLLEQMHEMLREYKNTLAIGLAVPGPYFREEGHIAVLTKLPNWQKVNFIQKFKDEFVPPIFFEQDANAGALAEWWFGNHAQPLHTLAYFLVGEGVGSGIIERGNLLLGAQGVASEIGHISIDVAGPRCECGNFGCLEQYCSSLALLQRAQQCIPHCLPQEPLKACDACNYIFDAARAGNQKAREIVREIAEYIGYGCVTLINAYNPDVIVIGDSVSQGGDLLLPTIQEVVEQRVVSELHSRVQIKISDLKMDSTLYGAAAIATDKVLQLPSLFLTNGSKQARKNP
ncbi:MAG: ROK family transcriptional regulator [Coriobacteriales bacterium]|jgi:predicted NBD/HSP70 family sugar kinase/biotin operon repressor|nr:ROK family transcriptional regulator [Coriobacteriales bacterium]